MKKLIIAFLLFPVLAFSQYEFEHNNDVKIYGYLEMDSLRTGFLLKPVSVMPLPDVRGTLIYDYSVNTFLIANGATWDTLGKGGGGSYWTVYGDTIYYPAGDVQIDSLLRLKKVPLVTDDTYSLVADADGNIGYYGAAPTITCVPSPSLMEYGTTNTITVSGSVTNTISATFSSGRVWDTNDSRNNTFTLSGVNYSQAVSLSFDPIEGVVESNLYVSSIDWVAGDNSGTATANATINGCYPILYGVSTTDYTSNTVGLYHELSKLVTAEGSTYTTDYRGTGYIYYCIPVSWSDTELSSIKSHNNFEQWNTATPTFVRIAAQDVISTTATPWTKGYVIYKLITPITDIDWTNWSFIQ